VEISVTLAINYILDSIPSYTGLLKETAWQVGQMAATLLLADIIDKAFPPNAKGPNVIGLMSGSATVILDGSQLGVMGTGFDSDGGCTAILVTPLVTGALMSGIKLAVGGIPSFKDLKGKDVWKAAKAVKDTIDGVQSLVKLAGKDMPEVAKKGVVTYEGSLPGTSEPQFMELGKLPKGVNCGFLPQPALLYPICPTTGRGPVFKFTIMPGKC